MLKVKKRGLMIVLSGPSGAGKGTICHALKEAEPTIWESVSMTTRSPRINEREGVDYYFVSRQTFEEEIKNHNLVEYAIVQNGEYYGTPKLKLLEKLEEGIDVLLEIDIEGALQIKEQFPEALFIFIMPPSMKELKSRLIKRGTETKEKLLERFSKAYQEINELTKYNYVVVNDTVENAVQKVEAILTAERCRVDRIEEVDVGNKEELLHENLVDL